jgi:glutathione S-transferase
MYQLHYFSGNASFIPHVILNEIGANFELHLVDRTVEAHKSAAYKTLNPTGRIPALIDTKLNMTLFETAAICLHLCDQHPETNLAPALGTLERSQFYKWLIYQTNTIQPDILMFYYADRYSTDATHAEAIKAAAEIRLTNWFQIIEDNMGDGPYLAGDQFTAADIFLLMLCRWGRYLATPPNKLPKIGMICDAVLARPAVQKTIADEKIKGDFLA